MTASLAGRLGLTTNDLWYVSRASGVVLLVLATATVVLGVVVRGGWVPRSTLRFVVGGLHRNVALLCVAVLAVHVVTAELDPFVTIGWAAAVVPYGSHYRALWIGLGAVSLDLLLAVTATSALRRFLSYRAWRAVHLTAYAAWPTAFAHSLQSGSDTGIAWVDAVLWACAAAVALALVARLAATAPTGRWSRRAAEGRSAAPVTVALPGLRHGSRRHDPLADADGRLVEP